MPVWMPPLPVLFTALMLESAQPSAVVIPTVVLLLMAQLLMVEPPLFDRMPITAPLVRQRSTVQFDPCISIATMVEVFTTQSSTNELPLTEIAVPVVPSTRQWRTMALTSRKRAVPLFPSALTFSTRILLLPLPLMASVLQALRTPL